MSLLATTGRHRRPRRIRRLFTRRISVANSASAVTIATAFGLFTGWFLAVTS